jgi:hypothetical protein
VTRYFQQENINILSYSISKSKLTLPASPCRMIDPAAARLRVMFDLEMEFPITSLDKFVYSL